MNEVDRFPFCAPGAAARPPQRAEQDAQRDAEAVEKTKPASRLSWLSDIRRRCWARSRPLPATVHDDEVRVP
jgi:hypothetical protein